MLSLFFPLSCISRESYEQLLKHLATYNSTPKTLPQSKAMTLRAIHEAISNPEVLNFEDLFNLKAVQALAMDKIFAFLKIFLSENLQEYRKFVKSNPKFAQEQGLSEESNVRKIRLLSMASLAAQHAPGEISYDAIAKALEIPQEDVEFWVIDGKKRAFFLSLFFHLQDTLINRCICNDLFSS